MRSPPAERPTTKTTSGEVEKQAPASEAARRVRIINADGMLVDVRTADQLNNYLKAQNAEIKRNHAGHIVYIRLLSFGDDRGHSSERHGRSTTTTQRVRNEHGIFVGGDHILEHKPASCEHWPQPRASAASQASDLPHKPTER
jgi:hypothetical protein